MDIQFHFRSYSEEIQKELEELNSEYNSKPPKIVTKVLSDIANIGIVCYPWNITKRALLYQIYDLVDNFYEKKQDCNRSVVDDFKSSIRNYLNVFENPPFTLQRLCEIATSEGEQFSTTRKLLNALTKLTRVRTTIQVLSEDEYKNEFEQTITNFMEEIKKKEEEALPPSPIPIDDNMEIVG